MTETVHEKGFHDTFEVVKTPVIKGICLSGMNRTVLLVAEKLVDWEVIEDGIEKQRPQVLEEEKSAILDLWT